MEQFNSFLERQFNELSPIEQKIIMEVWDHKDQFIQWPAKALLLWEGCVRQTSGYQYPEELKRELKSRRTTIDSRMGNGPALTSFLHAGGKRPKRSNDQCWHIDHMYNGKFPCRPDGETLHAVRHGKHFTQSAGLVSTHPIAEALADEYFYFSWLIRLESFKRFGYDPDRVFCSRTDEYGFKI
jgi:hypothetical protein